MVATRTFANIGVELDGHIALVEIQRPPYNYFSLEMVSEIADAFEMLAEETDCRAIVFAAQGSAFCAGAQLGRPATEGPAEPPPPGDRHGRRHLYNEALRLFRAELPVVAAVQGAAIGGGLGLALVADFRVAAPEARFSSNFARLGFHQGFGLTVTLPDLVGQQHAMRMLLTGVRVTGEQALTMGMCDELVPMDELRPKAYELANEIAGSAPLSVRAVRRTMRRGLVERLRSAVVEEAFEQDWLRQTNDYREGVRASAERREPNFEGR